MDIFYQYNKTYNFEQFKQQIKNIQLIELNEDNYETEQKPDKLKYFREPKISDYPLNLNDGFERYRFREKVVFYGNPLSKVIKYDMKNCITLNSNENQSFNIFTHRNAILNIIRSHSYKNASKYFDWNLCVTKFGNSLYMYSENDKTVVPPNKITSYHYKLEQILFSDSPYTEPKTDEPVDENIRLNGIYQCQLGNFNLIYSAEVQGIISDTEIKDFANLDLINQCSFVNTKVLEKKQGKGYAIKRLQKYFQNYLINVEVTYFAERDADGYVHDSIKPVKTKSMCKLQPWNPKEYEQFLYDFLSLIVEKMAHVNSLVTTYEFNYSSKDKAVYYKIHEGKTKKSFLAEDYIKFMENN